MKRAREGGRAEEGKWEREKSVRRMPSSNSSNEDAHSFACHPLWLEKYRPMRLEDILGQEKVCERVHAFLRRRTLPNLLLFGERGVGKTSLVFAIARELFGDFWLSLIHISEPTRPY